jgi:ABC-2 type transport system ATP-binding protein
MKNLVDPEYVQHVGLHPLDLNLDPGEIIGVLGPNGAGKSTLIKLLTGIQTPTGGDVLVFGHRPSERSRSFLQNIGVVFGHKSSMWWDLPVYTNFRSIRLIYGIEHSRFQRRLNELAAVFGLSKAILERPVRVLSLGERVKCEVMGALLHEPRLLFLDEPTVGLDITSRTELRALLRGYADENKIGIILTSHDVGDIEACCSRVLLINQGTLAFDGKIEALKANFSDIVRLRIKANRSVFSSNEKDDINQRLKDFIPTDDGYKVTNELVEISLPKDLTRKAIRAIVDTDIDVSIEVKNPDLEEVLLYHFRNFRETNQS